MFHIDFTPLDIFMSFIMGIPIGVLFPVRPRYLLIDLITALTFVISITLVRIFESTFTGEVLAVGALLSLFLMGAFLGTRFNRGAKDKEAVIKRFRDTGNVTTVEDVVDKDAV